jgi:DNA-binding CsgD family transcriptional regulator
VKTIIEKSAETINNVLLSLHAGCREQSVESFKAWALNEVKRLVPFEKSNWGSGVLVGGNFVLFGAPTQGIDSEFERRFNEMRHLDVRATELIVQTSATLNRDCYDPTDTDQVFRRYVLDPSDIRYGLYSGVLDKSTGVLDAIVLMRANESVPFTERERSTVEVLVPHLSQACAANRLERAQDNIDAGRRALYHSIVSTRDGLLVAAETSATRMLLTEWPDWVGGALPAPIADTIKAVAISVDLEPAQVIRFKTLVAHIHVNIDQVLVRLRAPGVIDSLGPRELLVAERFAEGWSYKEIAKALDISPSTVSNQLSVVYSKLGVSNKIAMRRELERWR